MNRGWKGNKMAPVKKILYKRDAITKPNTLAFIFALSYSWEVS